MFSFPSFDQLSSVKLFHKFASKSFCPTKKKIQSQHLMFQLKLFSLWQGTIKASQGLPFHCPETPWIPQGDVSGPPVQIEVLPCPESRTSNKINPKPTELTFCFHCLLKRATRFGQQTPRLFPKKAFDFHLSAENGRAAAAVLRLQTQGPRPARRMAYHFPPQ